MSNVYLSIYLSVCLSVCMYVRQFHDIQTYIQHLYLSVWYVVSTTTIEMMDFGLCELHFCWSEGFETESISLQNLTLRSLEFLFHFNAVQNVT